MTIFDMAVLGFVGYMFLKNSKDDTTSTAESKGLLSKLTFGLLGSKEANPLLEKARLWQELNAKATEEQKAVLAKLWPLLNQEKVS